MARNSPSIHSYGSGNGKTATVRMPQKVLPVFYQFLQGFSLKAIRAEVERFLKSVPNSKPWSIISDPQFKEANDALDAFPKSTRSEGKVGDVVHKKTITKEQVKMLFERQQLGPADANVPQSWSGLRGFISHSTLGKEERKASGR